MASSRGPERTTFSSSFVLCVFDFENFINVDIFFNFFYICIYGSGAMYFLWKDAYIHTADKFDCGHSFICTLQGRQRGGIVYSVDR